MFQKNLLIFILFIFWRFTALTMQIEEPVKEHVIIILDNYESRYLTFLRALKEIVNKKKLLEDQITSLINKKFNEIKDNTLKNIMKEIFKLDHYPEYKILKAKKIQANFEYKRISKELDFLKNKITSDRLKIIEEIA